MAGDPLDCPGFRFTLPQPTVHPALRSTARTSSVNSGSRHIIACRFTHQTPRVDRPHILSRPAESDCNCGTNRTCFRQAVSPILWAILIAKPQHIRIRDHISLDHATDIELGPLVIVDAYSTSCAILTLTATLPGSNWNARKKYFSAAAGSFNFRLHMPALSNAFAGDG